MYTSIMRVNMHFVEHGVRSNNYSFARPHKSITFHNGLLEKNCLQRILVMLHHFKYNEFNISY